MSYFNFLTSTTHIDKALSSAYNFQVPDYGDPPTVNIHDTLFTILEMILGVFKYCFEFLKGVQFLGTNLLTFTITIMLLAALFPIIFSIVGARFTNNANKAAKEFKKR